MLGTTQTSPDHTKRDVILCASVILLLLSGVYLGSVSRPSAPVGMGVSSLPYHSSCSGQFSYDMSSPISVLVATSNSTGRICVEYVNSLHNSISSPAYSTVYEYNGSGTYGVCDSCAFNLVSSIQVTASQDNITFEPASNPGSEVEDVTYTIMVPANVTSGIYGIFLYQFCSLFPLFVVPSNASTLQLGRSEFTPWYPHQGSCPAQILSASVLGVGGFRVASV